MRKLLYSFVLTSILLLASFTSFASFDEPGGGGTVPEYSLWLPVVRMAAPCGVTEGTYELYTDRYPPPGPYKHAISYIAPDDNGFHAERILVASDYLFESILADGGVSGAVIPSFRITLELSTLKAGQTYHAKMQYTCYGTPAQTPVLTFVAMEPPQP